MTQRHVLHTLDLIINRTGPALAPEKRLSNGVVRNLLIDLREAVAGSIDPAFDHCEVAQLIQEGVHITCPPGYRIVVEYPEHQ